MSSVRRDEKYLRFIREQLCAACGCWPSEADHHPTKGSGRWSDFLTWPLCTRCHRERHDTGIITFCTKYKLDPEAVMAGLGKKWRKYGTGGGTD